MAGSSPGWVYNYIPSAAEWNFWWSKKQDFDSPSSPSLIVTDGTLSIASVGTITIGPGLVLSSDGDGQATITATGSPATFITVDTPDTGVDPGDPLTISGTYVGLTPTGFNYSIDGDGPTMATSPVIGSGVWSFVITAPPSGVHYLSVTPL